MADGGSVCRDGGTAFCTSVAKCYQGWQSSTSKEGGKGLNNLAPRPPSLPVPTAPPPLTASPLRRPTCAPYVTPRAGGAPPRAAAASPARAKTKKGKPTDGSVVFPPLTKNIIAIITMMGRLLSGTMLEASKVTGVYLFVERAPRAWSKPIDAMIIDCSSVPKTEDEKQVLMKDWASRRSETETEKQSGAVPAAASGAGKSVLKTSSSGDDKEVAMDLDLDRDKQLSEAAGGGGSDVTNVGTYNQGPWPPFQINVRMTIRSLAYTELGRRSVPKLSLDALAVSCGLKSHKQVNFFMILAICQLGASTLWNRDSRKGSYTWPQMCPRELLLNGWSLELEGDKDPTVDGSDFLPSNHTHKQRPEGREASNSGGGRCALRPTRRLLGRRCSSGTSGPTLHPRTSPSERAPAVPKTHLQGWVTRPRATSSASPSLRRAGESLPQPACRRRQLLPRKARRQAPRQPLQLLRVTRRRRGEQLLRRRKRRRWRLILPGGRRKTAHRLGLPHRHLQGAGGLRIELLSGHLFGHPRFGDVPASVPTTILLLFCAPPSRVEF